MVRAALFDLDGTLLDTLPDIHACVTEMCDTFGYPRITIDRTRAYIGEGARRLVERALPQGAENVEECFAFFKERYGESSHALTRLYDGEMECLYALKERGVRLAVVTNKPQRATETSLARFFPADMFDFAGGDSGMFPCKPDPSLARYAALTLRVAPRDCLFIGDGEPDALTARNAGMRGVSALWGYRTREQLEAAGAREFVSDFAELRKFVAEIS